MQIGISVMTATFPERDSELGNTYQRIMCPSLACATSLALRAPTYKMQKVRLPLNNFIFI